MDNDRTPKQPQIHGTTALHAACEAGEAKTAEILLNAVKDNETDRIRLLSAKDNMDQTPLHCAAAARKQTDHFTLVRLLLSSGADKRVKNSEGLLPEEICRKLGYHDIGDYIAQWDPLADFKLACKKLGVQKREAHLDWVVKEYMNAVLPPGWMEVEDQLTGRWYFFNMQNGESNWEHPLLSFFRKKLNQERQRHDINEKARSLMRRHCMARPWKAWSGPFVAEGMLFFTHTYNGSYIYLCTCLLLACLIPITDSSTTY